MLEYKINNRWDFVWKSLTDPKQPWGPTIIEWIAKDFVPLGNIRDYRVECHTLSTEFQTLTGTEIADRIIVLYADNVERVVHFEFQSGNCDDICFRLLKYGVAAAKEDSHSAWEEWWTLPYSAVVLVRNVSGVKGSDRKLNLVVNGKPVTIDYPVVRVEEVVPGVRELMAAQTPEGVIGGMRVLLRRLPDFRNNQLAVDDFSRITYLLSDKRIFDEDPKIAEQEVVQGMSNIKKGYVTFEEAVLREGRQEGRQEGLQEGLQEGRQEGIEEMLRAFAREMGISLEEARRKFCPNTGSGASGQSTSVGRMKL